MHPQHSTYSSTLKMERERFSEILVNIYHNTWRHIPQGSILRLTLSRYWHTVASIPACSLCLYDRLLCYITGS
jgi:hypothetical protein